MSRAESHAPPAESRAGAVSKVGRVSNVPPLRVNKSCAKRSSNNNSAAPASTRGAASPHNRIARASRGPAGKPSSSSNSGSSTKNPKTGKKSARGGHSKSARGPGPPGLTAQRGNTEGILPTDREQPPRRRTRRLGNGGRAPPPTGDKHSLEHRRSQQHELVVVSHNIDGVTDEKLVALFSYMKTHDVDIMHLQETKGQDPFPEWAFHHGYKIIHEAPARGSRSGGCATLVKQRWECKQLKTLPEEGDVCWTIVDLGYEKSSKLKCLLAYVQSVLTPSIGRNRFGSNRPTQITEECRSQSPPMRGHKHRRMAPRTKHSRRGLRR